MFKIDIKNETGFVAKNATTNGGDASRVGIEKGGKIQTLLNNSCIFTRDASLPLEVAFGA